MSEHTKEPWEVAKKASINEDGEGYTYSEGDWHIYPPLGECGPVATACNDANAHRIVACINACKGVSTSTLEDTAELGAMAALAKAEAQRDKLAKALWDWKEWWEIVKGSKGPIYRRTCETLAELDTEAES